MSTLTNIPSLSSVNAAAKRHRVEPSDDAPIQLDPLAMYDLSSVGKEFEPGIQLKRLQEHQNRRDELIVRAWRESFLIEGAEGSSSPKTYISLKRYENRVQLSNCLMTALFSVLIAAFGGYIYGIILLNYGGNLLLP
jgi:hypothetical protein